MVLDSLTRENLGWNLGTLVKLKRINEFTQIFDAESIQFQPLSLVDNPSLERILTEIPSSVLSALALQQLGFTNYFLFKSFKKEILILFISWKLFIT